ncbi:MBL fold metallo-hydrolase [Rathayibacter sp. CAU 1779]
MTSARSGSQILDLPDLSARGPFLPNLLAVSAAIADAMSGPVRPHRRDARIARSGIELPAASRSVTLTAFRQARRELPTPMVADGVRTPSRVANSMTSFLVQHPEANILVDPAICDGIRERVLPQLPAPMRGLVTPPPSVASVRSSLLERGLSFGDIDFALPTHLHWDHVSGLVDAPEVPIRVLEREWCWAMDGVRAPAGVARRGLVDRSVDFYELDGPPVLGFARSQDLFGDGSITAVDMSGHTPGSVGFLLHLGDTGTGPRWALLVGDAIWHTVQLPRVRGKGLARVFDSDRRAALEVIRTVSGLDASVVIVPSHDPDAAAPFMQIAV